MDVSDVYVRIHTNRFHHVNLDGKLIQVEFLSFGIHWFSNFGDLAQNFEFDVINFHN